MFLPAAPYISFVAEQVPSIQHIKKTQSKQGSMSEHDILHIIL